METSKDLFRELEKAEQLFSNGSIRNGQKVLREVLIASKSLNKVSNKLRHKINFVLNESKYFDEMSSFATNPKRDNLILKIKRLTLLQCFITMIIQLILMDLSKQQLQYAQIMEDI